MKTTLSFWLATLFGVLAAVTASAAEPAFRSLAEGATPENVEVGFDGKLHVTEVRTGRVWQIRAETGEKRQLARLQSAADQMLDDNGTQLIVTDSKAGQLGKISFGK